MKIEDYAFLSDTHTAALVGRDTSIDWLCFPRFDSGACFASLLGDEKNGRWIFCPKPEITKTSRRYRGDSLILETEIVTGEGAVRVIDFMPPRGKYPDIVRIVEGVRGRVDLSMRLVIRFDYGRTVPWVRKCDGDLHAIAGPNALVLRTPVKTHGRDLMTLAEFVVREGERVPFVLTWFPSHEKPPRNVNAEHALRDTEKFWSKWSKQCTYKGEWRDVVMRSLITLKGLTYAPTGGIVAAATTSLPEKIGSVRNWDYRFCWLRDSTFTLYALLNAGFHEEARAWRDWLLRAVAGTVDQAQILYGLAGERHCPESEIDWLRGYENSRPVRIGNAAAAQFQLDVYGEVIDSFYLALRSGVRSDEMTWRLQRQLVRFVENHWRDPDEGIWEVRGPRRHFTHSKLMAWVAADRAVKSSEQFSLNGDTRRWRKLREEIRREICAHGYHPARRAFTQFFGSEKLDASLLMMPLVGFLPVSDERVRNTVEAIRRELVHDGFVMRYHPDDSKEVDGLPPGEGAFLPCTGWLADCLHLLNRNEEAREFFQRMLDARNDLGLLAEEYDPRARRQLGNFPQAFSHVGLVNTAFNLSQQTGPAHQRGAGKM